MTFWQLDSRSKHCATRCCNCDLCRIRRFGPLPARSFLARMSGIRRSERNSRESRHQRKFGRDIEIESFIRSYAETLDRWNFGVVLFERRFSSHSVSTVSDKFFTLSSFSGCFLFFSSTSRRSNNTNEIVNRFGGRRLNLNRTSLAISRLRAVIRRIRFQTIHDRQCFEKPTFDFFRHFLLFL